MGKPQRHRVSTLSRRPCGRGWSHIFGEPRYRVEGERHGDCAVRRVKPAALRLRVTPRRALGRLAVAAAATLVVLMATACAIGGGPDRQVKGVQKSTGTSEPLLRRADATALELTFSPSAGNGLVARFSLRCDRVNAGFLAFAARICKSLAQREDVLLPPSMTVCPLPTGVFILTVKGTLAGKGIDRLYAPCSSGERMVIATWMRLLEFTPSAR
jgi:hypothetical protein